MKTTSIVAVIAVALSATAFFNRPSQNVKAVESLKDTNLFEEYKTFSVRQIEISRLTEDGRLEKISLQKRGETWTIPAKFGFVADNVGLIPLVIGCLNELNIYEVYPGEGIKHQDYGVIDPEQALGETEGVGAKISLSDRNGKEIGTLIVGDRQGDSQGQQGERIQFAVRRPGQAEVFLVDFNKNILRTEFGAWINSNLFRISDQGGQIPVGFSIDNYVVQPTALANRKPGEDPRQWVYATTLSPMGPNQGQWGVSRLLHPNSDQSKLVDVMKVAQPRLIGRAAVRGVPAFQIFLSSVVQLPIVDVRRKPRELEIPFKDMLDEKFKVGELKGLAAAGFYVSDDGEIQGARGRVSVAMRQGVNLHLVLGSTTQGNTATELNRYAMLFATLDRERLPKEPTPLTAEEEKDEAKKVNYLRAKETYDNALKFSSNSAREFNNSFARWIYLVDERATGVLFPERDALFLRSSLNLEAVTGGADNPGKKSDDGKVGKPDNKKSDGKASSEKKTDASKDNDGKKDDGQKDDANKKVTGDKNESDKGAGGKKSGQEKNDDKKK